MQKIGILTGGGDAPGLNGVIRGAVLTCVGIPDLEIVGIRDGFGGFAREDGIVPLDRTGSPPGARNTSTRPQHTPHSQSPAGTARSGGKAHPRW